MTSILKKTLVLMIRCYQVVLSPLFGNCCRFDPCCSHYCINAIERHGSLKGIWLGVIRLCKCHPLNPGGPDPVPEYFGSRSVAGQRS